MILMKLVDVLSTLDSCCDDATLFYQQMLSFSCSRVIILHVHSAPPVGVFVCKLILPRVRHYGFLVLQVHFTMRLLFSFMAPPHNATIFCASKSGLLHIL